MGPVRCPAASHTPACFAHRRPKEDTNVAEVPADQEPRVQVVLRVPDAGGFRAGADVEVVTPFEETHYGSQEMTIRDPDGRLWNLQAPAGS
jgi:hypothetical protein